MSLQQQIFDEIIDNALNVLRLIVSQQKDVFARLKKLEADLLGEIAAEDLNKAQKRKLNAFFNRVDNSIEYHFQQLQLDFDFAGIARYAARDVVTSFELLLGLDSLNLPPAEYFKSVKSEIMIFGAPSADWWRGQSQDLQFKFKQQIRQGLLNAETNQQLVSRIVGKSGEPGLMETSKRNASALVHSSVQTVANDARRNTYKANNGLIKGIQQVSTLDGHTSLTCIAYSGKKWDLDFKPIGKDGLPYNGGTPRHFQCRSVEIPITKTFAEMGLKIPESPKTTRASSDGQIDANTSFDDYLKRKGKAYQDEMLGNGRAELWRAGKITLKDLVTASGRPATLAELLAGLAKKEARRR